MGGGYSEMLFFAGMNHLLIPLTSNSLPPGEREQIVNSLKKSRISFLTGRGDGISSYFLSLDGRGNERVTE
jgi:hypothetical protein